MKMDRPHTKLYIIGNGFDLHHNINSKYSDFKSYLEMEDPDLAKLVEDYLPADEDWGNLESSLGDIDITNIIDNASVFLASYGADDWSDSGHHDFQYEIGKIVEGLSTSLRTRFAKWVRQLEIPSASSSNNRLAVLDNDGLYLSFNYTPTLEFTYSVPAYSVLHIHGAASMPDSDLVLGHAWNPSGRKSLNDHPDIEEQDTRVTEAYEEIDTYFSNTFKPSEKIIRENANFFSGLRSIREVYVLGHSLNEVDWMYFETVIKAIDVKSARWIIACRYPSDMPDVQAAIERLGVPRHLVNTVSWGSMQAIPLES